MDPIEEEIVKLLNEGNSEGLKKLFRIYYKPLCVYAMNFLDSFEESEDIVQEIFVKFWENFQSRHFEGSLRAYLFSSVQYACGQEMKKKKKYSFEACELLEDLEDYNDTEFEKEYRYLYEELNRLPEQCRKVFESIILQDMKYKEVAASMGISVNTVKTHFSRALKQLRKSLNPLVLLLLFKNKHQ